MNTTDPPKPSISEKSKWAEDFKILCVIFAPFVIWAWLKSSNSSTRQSSSSSAPHSQVLAAPPAASLPSNLVPTVPQAQSLSELQGWYARLYAQREALNLTDVPAIQSFNQEAARYMAAVAIFRSQRATVEPTGANTTFYNASSSSRFDPNYRPPVGEHYVAPYGRSSGTVVQGHYSTNPDGSFWNNYSSKGNVNPHSG